MYLFVYGTLMSDVGHPMGARLAREARLLGPGTISGRLFDLGRYPALVETDSDDELVHGEVYALNSPPASFRWLDPYEGIVPGRQDYSEYDRLLRPVRLHNGKELTAYVYVYRRDLTRGRYIQDGRWRPEYVARETGTN